VPLMSPRFDWLITTMDLMHKNGAGAGRKIELPPFGYNLLPGITRDGGYSRHPGAAPAEHSGGMARINHEKANTSCTAIKGKSP
jgi:hypothetical protein